MKKKKKNVVSKKHPFLKWSAFATLTASHTPPCSCFKQGFLLILSFNFSSPPTNVKPNRQPTAWTNDFDNYDYNPALRHANVSSLPLLNPRRTTITTNMNASAPTKNAYNNTNARKKKAKKNTNPQTKDINKNTSTRTDDEAKVNTNIQVKDMNEGTNVYKKMVYDLGEAVPSNDKDPECASGTTDPYTMTTEHTELYKKLIRDLTETVPTNDKAIETAQCRMLMAASSDDLSARHVAYRGLWGSTKSIKKSDEDMIAQLSTDIIKPLETILHNATNPVSIVFYNTMKGAYYHFMAEYLTDLNKLQNTMYQDQALSAFMTAKESATSSGMSVIDPFYLELHISLAKLYYLMNMYRSARLTNLWAFKATWKCKDQQDEEGHKLSVAIKERMQTLNNRWIDDMVMGLTY